MSSASIYFSFVKDGDVDASTPCWAQLDVVPALQQAKGFFFFFSEHIFQPMFHYNDIE